MASSKTNNEEEYPPESRKFIRRVIKISDDKLKLKSINPEVTMNRIVMITGLQSYVTRILSTKSKMITVEKLVPVDRGVIQSELQNFYLTRKIIPTTTQLFNALNNKIPPYIDRNMFRKMLVKMGYVWKVISSETRNFAVVFENPQVAFERYNYLNHVHIKNDAPVFYVEENCFDCKGNYYDMYDTKILMKKPDFGLKCQCVIYAVSRTGVVASKFIDELNENTFEEWISTELMLHLPTPSVIVMNKAKHHCRKIREPPTYDSLKVEIIKWLDYHNVPSKKTMSKAQLFDLVEKFTDLDANMYAVDKILELRGHRVLRIPDCINNLTISNCVYRLIKKNIPGCALTSLDGSFRERFSNIHKNIIHSITQEMLENYHEHICREYDTIICADCNVSKIESLHNLPYTDEDEFSDVPELSDSDIDSDD